ncbi:SulP family inorganic anion transporter [Thalassospira sp. MCCC 1A03138]|uniref:SulP family inorganic anion transporter n=1 Tax=Thalassospira sp. MCCC 1A03138 TaxID=1470576 RepID=UPI000A1EEB59|nr:SulP family inorganic anion transporter [Thalassospira sp. MCCC 1A03138]OSQ29042.1 SulP family sulfate transporter [Thalassospira sp. MCCC 1A03138]
METRTSKTNQAPEPGYADLFTPKLVTVLREGYGFAQLRADAIAGLTVAIVALPLSMAIAIASGVSPAQGLYTAIVGGILVSLLGGSRFQIGGPAGAFIVLVAGTVQTHGLDGLIIATILSGLMLLAIGALKLGTYIKFIPYPVTVGFTAGIAVIIFASQIKDLLGLTLPGKEPGPLLEKLPVIWAALPGIDPVTVALSGATILVIVGTKRLRPHWPGMLIAVAGAALATALFSLPVSTIGSVFGGIPGDFPMPVLPEFTLAKVQAVLPNAIAFALLGAIESLLSAVVADGMTGRHHRSNCELVAQGVANMASGLFGGICVTGTIARTATNIRAGAHGPVSGVLHALFLLLFILVAAPLASFIPLASLAGVLAIVAWNMIEKHAIATLLRASRGDAAVLLVTFLLTIFRDLLEAIVVGFALGSVLFIQRMSKTTAIATHSPFVSEDRADGTTGGGGASDISSTTDPDIMIYRITGVFFFGAAASIGSVLDRIGDTHRALIIDFAAVPFLDSTAANTIAGLARKTRGRGIEVILTGTSHDLRRELFAHGIKPPLVHYEIDIEKVVGRLRAHGLRNVTAS